MPRHIVLNGAGMGWFGGFPLQHKVRCVKLSSNLEPTVLDCSTPGCRSLHGRPAAITVETGTVCLCCAAAAHDCPTLKTDWTKNNCLQGKRCVPGGEVVNGGNAGLGSVFVQPQASCVTQSKWPQIPQRAATPKEAVPCLGQAVDTASRFSCPKGEDFGRMLWRFWSWSQCSAGLSWQVWKPRAVRGAARCGPWVRATAMACSFSFSSRKAEEHLTRAAARPVWACTTLGYRRSSWQNKGSDNLSCVSLLLNKRFLACTSSKQNQLSLVLGLSTSRARCSVWVCALERLAEAVYRMCITSLL